MNHHDNANSTSICLLLHDVSDRPDSSGFTQPTAAKYKHSVRQFADYLDAVSETELPVVPSTQPLQQHKRDDRHPVAPTVTFTFDDGGAAAPTAANLLEDRGWRGVFFVTTDLIGTSGFMTERQIIELHQRGHIIGSHSCSHPDVFRSLKRQEMRDEWQRSRDVLQELLNCDVHHASVPGGDCDRATLEEASAAGYRQIFTSEQQTKPWTCGDATCYGRLMMVETTSPETLQRWLFHPTIGILPERFLRFTKSSVKQLMGPMYVRLMHKRRQLHKAG